MILRLAANAALHTAGGVAMGVTGVLALCTLAQTVKKLSDHAPGRSVMPHMPSSPYTPPEASETTKNTGPYSSGRA